MSDELALLRARVDAILSRFFRGKRAACAALDRLAPVIDAAEELTIRGGKRLRPALVVGGYASVAPLVDLEPIAEAAACFELLQTYLLIQDDWMDRDELRRGGPTIHVRLLERYPDAHRASSVAILASDLSASWAFEMLLAARFPHDRLFAALAGFQVMLEEVIYGQFLDVVGTPDVALVHLYKTAGYTVRWPLRIGAILGGASEAQLGALDAFAKPCGLAFQLRDDLLGTFGDPAVTGKPASSDLLAGKETALIAEARHRLDPAGRAALEGVLGRGTASAAELEDARRALERCGARAAVEETLDSQLETALLALQGSGLEAAGVRRLEALARLVVSRKT